MMRSKTMANATERSEVLHMIEEGKISAADGARLLAALQAKPDQSSSDLDKRWLRVHVTDLGTNRTRFNVNVPLRWVDAGLRIGRTFAPELDEIDWKKILTAARDNQAVRLLEVEDLDDNQRVEILIN
jgi:hypothetical protein